MDVDLLKSAAEAYKKLIGIEYHIVLGRKGKDSSLTTMLILPILQILSCLQNQECCAKIK